MTKADHIAAVVAEKDTRIRELEAERDEWKATAETVSMLRDKAVAEAEAATIERCAQHADDCGWPIAADAIRALAKPAKG
jgi:hypothetical protein